MKKRENKLSRTIGLVLAIVQLIATGIFMAGIFKLNMLPTKYVVAATVALVLFFFLPKTILLLTVMPVLPVSYHASLHSNSYVPLLYDSCAFFCFLSATSFFISGSFFSKSKRIKITNISRFVISGI